MVPTFGVQCIKSPEHEKSSESEKLTSEEKLTFDP